jgi:hypothetical protein
MMRRLIHDEARRLGVEEGMEQFQWPSAHRTRLIKLHRIMKKLRVQEDHRADRPVRPREPASFD